MYNLSKAKSQKKLAVEQSVYSCFKLSGNSPNLPSSNNNDVKKIIEDAIYLLKEVIFHKVQHVVVY